MSTAVIGRVLRWGAIGLAVLIGVGAIGVVLGASFAARWVLAAYLEEIGASHDGLRTLRLDVLSGSASAGPLTVGGEAPATLRRIEVTVSLRGLLRGRALITSLRIEGLDVDGRRDAMGAITLAGLPLETLFGPVEDGSAETAPPCEDWLLGVSDLSVVGSQIAFTDLNGGEIELEIARFEVDRFAEWEPDAPTAFTLDATFNGMPLRYDGTIAPLAEPMTVDLSGGIEQITYAALARFAGERPTAEIAGALAVRGSHRVFLFPDGRLEGAASGEFGLQSFGLATAGGETAASERALVSFDLDYDMGLDQQAVLAGDIRLDVAPSRLVSALGEQVALTGATAEASGFSVREISGPGSADLLEGIADRLGLVAADGGRRLSLSDLIVRVVAAVAEEILSARLAISGRPSISLQGLSLMVPGEDGVEVFRSEVTTMFAASQALAAEQTDTEWRLDADLTAGAADYESRAVVAGETLRSRVASFSIASDALSARTNGTDTRLAFDLDVALTGSVNDAGGGRRLALAALRASSPGVEVVGQADLTGETRGPLTLEVEGIDGGISLEGRTLDLEGRSLRVDLDRLVLQRQNNAGATLSGQIRLGDWSIEEAGTPLEAGFTALDITLPTTVITLDRDGVAVRPATTTAGVPDPAGAAAPAPPPGAQIDAGDDFAPRISPSPPRPSLHEAPSDPEAVAPRAAPVPAMRPPVSLEASETSSKDEPTAQSVDEEAAVSTSADGGVFGVALAGFVGRLPSDGGILSIEGEGLDLQLSAFDLGSASSIATLDGQLGVSGWRLDDPVSGFAGSIGSVRLDTNGLQIDFSGDPPRLRGGFGAQIDALSAEAPAFADRRWEFGASTISAELAEAGFSGEATTGRGRVEIADARVQEAGGGASALAAGVVAIDGLSLGGDRLRVGAVSVAGLDMTITGQLLETLFFAESDDEALSERVTEAVALPRLRVETVDLGAGSRLLWTDEIADRRLRAEITIAAARVGPVDLADPSETTAFDVRMTTGGGAKASVSGTARPIADPPGFDVAARLDNVQLAPLSPYAETAVGFALETGVLSSALDARSSKGALDGLLHVMLADLRFTPAYPGAEEAFVERFVVSPSYAVNILRDDAGRIDLKFPVSGTLDDPDVDLSALMTKATGGVLASLLPFNWFSGDEWAWPQVVIRFAPGSIDLADGYEPLLVEVAQILVTDRGTPVTLCGVATLADVPDRAGLTTGGPTAEEVAAALPIALSRETAVRAYLETEGGVPADRLTRCEASFQDAPAVPGVLFSATQLN